KWPHGLESSHRRFSLRPRLRVDKRSGCSVGPWQDYPDRILDHDAFAPGTCPVLENRVSFDALREAGDKTLLSFGFVASERQGQPVQDIHILVEDAAKILGRSVFGDPANRSVLAMRKHSSLPL